MNATESGAPSVALTAMSPLRLTVLLIFTQLPGVLGYTIALPLLAQMAGDLVREPSSAYLAKLVAGILGPAMAIGSLLAGFLADRFNRRWLLIGFGALYLLFAVAPAFLDTLEMIVATRFVVGFAAAALMAIGLTMAGDYLPENKRASTIGLLSAFNMLASLGSLPLSGYVGEAGWRTPFLLYLLAAPLLLLALPSALPAPQKAALPEGTAKSPWHRGLPFGLLALAFLAGGVMTVPGIYTSFHLDSIGLGKTSTVANMLMLNAAIGAVFSALFGKAMARSSQQIVLGGACAMLALGLALLAWAPGMPMAMAGLLLMGAGLGWLAPGLPALAVGRAAEGQRGKLVGAVQGIASVAPILAVMLAEPLLPEFGTMGVMLGCGLIAAMLIPAFALTRKG